MKKIKFKYRRNVKDRMIAGLASGLADLMHIDPTWVRLLFVLLAIWLFPYFIIAYFVAALIVPQADAVEVPLKRYHRVKEKKMIGGVSTGLAEYFDIDVVLIRLAFLLSIALHGIGVLAYIALWIISPINETKVERDIIVAKTT